jgi:hypothetical protein
VAIGNGVMDMVFQEPSYAEYAYYHGLIPLGAKLRFEKDWASCLESVRTVLYAGCAVLIALHRVDSNITLCENLALSLMNGCAETRIAA